MTIPPASGPSRRAEDLPTHHCLACGSDQGREPATVTLPATGLAELGELLGVLDEFLRCAHGVADRLVDFYTARGQSCPGFTANNLLDQVGFTAAALRHQHQQREGAGQ